ncbi:effector-associated constant component EACC1 [Streptomyces sp. SudanB182_2057]|uniref:effector-associated constant component EACC1 n=1 Tax=Streptomyces sp. SudanB182_2057 TaxID=3035281 RepID=UPI003F576075
MELEPLIAALGSSTAVATLVRTLVLWMRSRHPKHVVVKDGDGEVSFDLSNRREALRYLQKLADSDREAR